MKRHHIHIWKEAGASVRSAATSSAEAASNLRKIMEIGNMAERRWHEAESRVDLDPSLMRPFIHQLSRESRTPRLILLSSNVMFADDSVPFSAQADPALSSLPSSSEGLSLLSFLALELLPLSLKPGCVVGCIFSSLSVSYYF